MTQRFKSSSNSVNLETLACEKYIARLLTKEKPTTATSALSQKCKDRLAKPPCNQNQLNRVRPNLKQQNLPSPKHSQSPNVLQYADDSALVEVTVKTTNPRQRSRSTTVDREPWGQLLKQQKTGDKVSVFGNFDPLRTLHFLAKELQYQLQAILPEDNTVQQIVCDMQYALKRVPPEVASTVQLQQAIDLLPPSRKGSKTTFERPERLKVCTSEKVTQTPPSSVQEDNEMMQRIMEESTVKLEASCRQMESLCTQLKNEKEYLEKQLQTEKENIMYLKKRIEELEIENNTILNPRIRSLEEDKRKLESELNDQMRKFDNQLSLTNSDFQTQLADLKDAKSSMEQDCAKLKHQMRLSALEKEKYIAVLAVRDKQINEIRSEMTQLQEVVNEQLLELHNNAFASMPSNGNIQGNPPNICKFENKENIGEIGDCTVSTIYSNDDIPVQHFFSLKHNNSFRDLPSGDIDASNIHHDTPENYLYRNPTKEPKMQHPLPLVDPIPFLEKLDSQASIRSMFNDVKKTAFAVASTPRDRSQLNLAGNR